MGQVRKRSKPDRRAAVRCTVYALASLVVSIVVALGIHLVIREPTLRRSAISPAEPLPALPSRADRLTYPFSIVAGGIFDVRDAERAAHADSLVRQHYVDIDLDNLLAIRTQAPMEAFVSYRWHDKVYWTAHKVSIPRGELVLTDGKHMIRGRCGNRIQGQLPPFAVLSSGVSATTLESAFDAPLPAIHQPPPRLQPVLRGTPPQRIDQSNFPPTQSSSTPEPRIFLLSSTAMLLLLLFSKRRIQRQENSDQGAAMEGRDLHLAERG